MRQVLAIATVFVYSFAFGQANSSQTASSQTARQALLEMFFGEEPNHLEKHLPDVTRRSLSKLSSPDAPNVLAEFSMMVSQLRSGGAALQMFDTGPTLLTAEDPRGGGPEKIELTVERDDLIGDENQIELALHMYKNGKEASLPVIPRFTFSMQSEVDVWRLNEISVTVRVPLSGPNFLKTIENQQRSQNEQMTLMALQQVNTGPSSGLCSTQAGTPASSSGAPPSPPGPPGSGSGQVMCMNTSAGPLTCTGPGAAQGTCTTGTGPDGRTEVRCTSGQPPPGGTPVPGSGQVLCTGSGAGQVTCTGPSSGQVTCTNESGPDGSTMVRCMGPGAGQPLGTGTSTVTTGTTACTSTSSAGVGIVTNSGVRELTVQFYDGVAQHLGHGITGDQVRAAFCTVRQPGLG